VASTDYASNEIDLRGMQQHEALETLEKYLDTALLTGLKTVSVIHGKGTGVLREGVQQYLKNHSRVLKTRLGAWNEGGTGITIVELRAE
jgi:DNA mismatch repair protein MutS2